MIMLPLAKQMSSGVRTSMHGLCIPIRSTLNFTAHDSTTHQHAIHIPFFQGMICKMLYSVTVRPDLPNLVLLSVHSLVISCLCQLLPWQFFKYFGCMHLVFSIYYSVSKPAVYTTSWLRRYHVTEWECDLFSFDVWVYIIRINSS